VFNPGWASDSDRTDLLRSPASISEAMFRIPGKSGGLIGSGAAARRVRENSSTGAGPNRATLDVGCVPRAQAVLQGAAPVAHLGASPGYPAAT